MGLSELPNIGKTLEQSLNHIGIFTYETLKQLGSVEVTIRLNSDSQSCYNKLYAIEGAIRGIRWHQLTKAEKEHIKTAYDSRLKEGV